MLRLFPASVTSTSLLLKDPLHVAGQAIQIDYLNFTDSIPLLS